MRNIVKRTCEKNQDNESTVETRRAAHVQPNACKELRCTYETSLDFTHRG